MDQQMLDSRRNAYRTDLANAALQGQIKSHRFVDGQTAQIAITAPLHKHPSNESMMLTQALRGETIQVFENRDGWAWVQLQKDAYVGYVPSNSLASGLTFATHTVVSPRALLFSNADLKSPPVGCLFFGSEISTNGQNGEYIANATGGYIHERTVAPIGAVAEDYVAVAERFKGVTYLWGGKTADGLDCSGLIQVALHAAGMICPRDSDMQMREVGTSLGHEAYKGTLQRGDLVFWEGHVGVMQDKDTLLHANAWHMEVADEPLSQAIERIAAAGGQVLDVRRP